MHRVSYQVHLSSVYRPSRHGAGAVFMWIHFCFTSWWETSVSFTLLAPCLFLVCPNFCLCHCSLFSRARRGRAQGRARGSHTVTDTGCHPGIRGPLCSYLSSTEKIQPLSHSRHLLRCLPLGLAHNFGCQNLLRASLLQWFAEYFDTFASENGKKELTSVYSLVAGWFFDSENWGNL